MGKPETILLKSEDTVEVIFVLDLWIIKHPNIDLFIHGRGTAQYRYKEFRNKCLRRNYFKNVLKKRST